MATFELSGPSGEKFAIDTPGDTEPTPEVLEKAKQAILAQSSDGGPNPPMFEGDFSADKNESDGLTGIAAAGTEVARGLGHGVGQGVADLGWVIKMATGGEVPQVQQAGKNMMQAAENLPETDMGGFSKGALNLVGEAGPMLATFGAGEALGLAKAGEAFIGTIGAASKSPQIAHYMKALVRPMGQATLFGTMNAVETAATLPETMEFKDKIDQITKAGTTGFVAGATLTPVLEHGFEITRKFGKRAGKFFFSQLGFAPDAAEKALDLSRKPGTYYALKVDPNVKDGFHFVETNVKDTSEGAAKTYHDLIISDQQQLIKGVREKHQELSSKLSSEIDMKKEAYRAATEQAKRDMDASVAQDTQEKLFQLDTKLSDITQKTASSYEKAAKANAEELVSVSQAFDAQVNSMIDLLKKNADSAEAAVIAKEPGSGFDVKTIIERIKAEMKSNHEITIGKEVATPAGLDPSKLSPTALKELQSQGAAAWIVKPAGITAKFRPESMNAAKALSGEEGLLARLEEIGKSNDGQITFAQLKEEAEKIRQAAYSGQFKDNGLADLYRALRPNQLLGTSRSEAEKMSEDYIFGGKGAKKQKAIPSAWRGSKEAEAELRIAADLDSATSDAINSYKEVRKTFLDGDVTSKAKGAYKNQAVLKDLRNFEEALKVPENVRLSSAISKYDRTAAELEAKATRTSEALQRARSNQAAQIRSKVTELKAAEMETKNRKSFFEKQNFTIERRNAVLAKQQELDQAQDMLGAFKRHIQKEQFDRALAEQEMASVATGNSMLGRVQRGAVIGAFFGGIYGTPAAPLIAATTFVLSPRVAIGVGRGLKRLGMSAEKAGTIKTASMLAKNKYIKQLSLGEILKSSRASHQSEE